jgi:hypothetical protein
VQDEVAARRLAIERRVVVKAVIPIDLEAEKDLLELVGLGDVEDAQDRDDAGESNGHRGPSRPCPINYSAVWVVPGAANERLSGYEGDRPSFTHGRKKQQPTL